MPPLGQFNSRFWEYLGKITKWSKKVPVSDCCDKSNGKGMGILKIV